jgi:tRNA-dihydrouridine synthase
MLGRGVYGRPWFAAQLERSLNDNAPTAEPGRDRRLGIVLDHYRDALGFYGERVGSKMFRKHLGWYVEQAPWPACAQARREAKARLCRLEDPREVEAELMQLWLRAA